jgi:hypothetical protein
MQAAIINVKQKSLLVRKFIYVINCLSNFNLVPRVLILARGKTLVGAGHVNPRIFGVNSGFTLGGVVDR